MKERFNIFYVIYCISYITISNVDQVDFLKERFKEKKFFNNEEHKSLLKKVNNNLLILPSTVISKHGQTVPSCNILFNYPGCCINVVLSLRFAKSSKRERRSQKPVRHEEDVKIFAN